MKPFSPHTKFFSSLKQVEKRLKSEHHDTTTQIPTQSSTDDLSAPLYLYPSCDQSHTFDDTQDSNPPLEFLSHHSPLDEIVTDPNDTVNEEAEEGGKDGIQEVLGQLGLLDLLDKDEAQDECHGLGSFYSKIVGVKGPKNEKEMERLDGWIKYYLNNEDEEDGGVKEPLRLVHLLIGKAVALANEKGGAAGLGDLEFPSTVQEFLEHDPPTLLL